MNAFFTGVAVLKLGCGSIGNQCSLLAMGVTCPYLFLSVTTLARLMLNTPQLTSIKAGNPLKRAF